MNQNAIQVSGLTKSFAALHVLQGIDLTVKRGNIYALLGANGAGKSTLIKILSTLLKADGGQASVNGVNVAQSPGDVRRCISLTGQFAAVDAVLTGRENLELIARLRHEKKPKQTAESLLRQFGLTDAADRRVSAYSGGMRRRLDIAMSLIGKPAVIFLDEPTTGLDPQARAEVWKTIRALRDGGITILLTTQYLEEAEALADSIGILHDGKMIAQGTLAELKRLFPPTKVEYVEKQPTLEEIFLTLTGDAKGEKQ